MSRTCTTRARARALHPVRCPSRPSRPARRWKGSHARGGLFHRSMERPGSRARRVVPAAVSRAASWWWCSAEGTGGGRGALHRAAGGAGGGVQVAPHVRRFLPCSLRRASPAHPSRPRRAHYEIKASPGGGLRAGQGHAVAQGALRAGRSLVYVVLPARGAVRKTHRRPARRQQFFRVHTTSRSQPRRMSSAVRSVWSKR